MSPRLEPRETGRPASAAGTAAAGQHAGHRCTAPFQLLRPMSTAGSEQNPTDTCASPGCGRDRTYHTGPFHDPLKVRVRHLFDEGGSTNGSTTNEEEESINGQAARQAASSSAGPPPAKKANKSGLVHASGLGQGLRQQALLNSGRARPPGGGAGSGKVGMMMPPPPPPPAVAVAPWLSSGGGGRSPVCPPPPPSG